MRTPAFIPRAISWFRRRWFIYLSDLAYVGLVYLDRYLVLVFLGLTATAVFTFYWGLANALQTIVLAALVQTGRPRLIILAGEGDNRGWQAELRRQLALALALALAMAAANFGLTETVIRLLPPGRIPADRTLFALLLGAVVLRCCSDVVNSGLISRGRDHAYAVANLLGVAATLAAVPLAAAAWGLTGAALALVLVAALLLVLRTSLLLARRGYSGAAGGGAIIANSIP